MLHTIPPLELDDAEHRYTSWKLARDVEMVNIEDTSLRSSTNLLAWEPDKIIPTGEIWYISIYRHIYDSEGNELDRLWSKPQPVFNEESNVLDALAPKYYIKEPFISNLKYTPDVGVSFTIAPFEGNIGYLKTMIVITDENNVQLLIKYIDISSNGDVLITPADIPLAVKNYLKISVMHIGLHSTASKVINDSIYLKRIYYTINGNTIDVDPKSANTFTIVGNTVVPITVLSATLVDLDDNFLSNCNVDGDKFTVPAGLEFNTGYKIKVTLIYTDENNTQQTISDVVYFTTREVSEIVNINPNFKYDFKLVETNKIPTTDNTFTVYLGRRFYTEELYSNLIPMPGINSKLNTYIYDKEYHTLIEAKSSVYNINELYGLQQLTEKYGVIEIIRDGKLRLLRYEYDSYAGTFTYKNTMYPNIYNVHADVLKTVIINNEVFVIGPLADNHAVIVVYKMNLDDGYLTEVLRENIGVSFWSLTVTNYNDESIMLVPIGGSVTHAYLYHPTDNTIRKSFTLPSKFINNAQYSVMLENGGVFNVLISETTNLLEYFYIAPNTDTLVTDSIPFNSNGKINNLIRLKNGRVLFISNGDGYNHLLELQ